MNHAATPFVTPFFTIVTYKCILSSLNRCQHCSHCEISSTRKKKKTKVEWSSFERAYLNCSDRESGWDSDMCAHALTHTHMLSERERVRERQPLFASYHSLSLRWWANKNYGQVKMWTEASENCFMTLDDRRRSLSYVSDRIGQTQRMRVIRQLLIQSKWRTKALLKW